MAKDKFERTKPHVNVGTIGHSTSDHDLVGSLQISNIGSIDSSNETSGPLREHSSVAGAAVDTLALGLPVDSSTTIPSGVYGVDHAPPAIAAVPEPSTLVLTVAMGASLLWRRRDY